MSDPAAIAQALHPVFQSLARAKVVYFMHISATCVFIYDHITSFGDEVELIWPTAWHAGKVFFMIERYLTWPELLLNVYIELADVPPKFCHDAFTFIAWSTTFAIVVTDMILVLRTWALWGGKRAVFFSLAIFLVAVATADSVIVASWIKNTIFIRASDAIPILHGCVIESSTNHVAYGWIVLTSFELVIVILTLIKGFEHFRMGHSNLITSLYRDGVLFFVYLFVLSLCNMLFIFTSPKEYIVLFGPCVSPPRPLSPLPRPHPPFTPLLAFLQLTEPGRMQRSFNAILSCKIVMHLQSALSTRPSATGGAPTEEISTGIGIGAGSTARGSGTRVVLLGRRPYAERSYTSEWFGGTSTVGG